MSDKIPIQMLVRYKGRTWVLGDFFTKPVTMEVIVKAAARVLLRWQDKAGHYKHGYGSEQIMIGAVPPDSLYFYWDHKKLDLALDKVVQCAKIATDEYSGHGTENNIGK